MANQLKAYPCTRCDGTGEIKWARHVLSGVCFKCAGSGKQYTKPSVSTRWAVLDSSGAHAYNEVAATPAKAIKKAMRHYERACEEFRAKHDMTNATAVPADEYWTVDRIEAASSAVTH